LIDAGAYIGDTTAYFLSRFPQLQAIAVEPNPESLELARRNLAPYENRVTLLPVALAATETPVRIAGTETGAQISSQGVEVEATTIVKLLDGLPNGRASIVKMDIEGAEREVFAASPETWLPRIDHIIVETHGPDIARDVLAALGRNGWRAVRYRNLYYCQPAGQYSPRESGGDSASR
jgi:FkbM family methyltransferase